MRRAIFPTIAISLALAVWMPGSGPANAAAPCCGISAIDIRSGIVTAQDTARKRSFQFKVTDPTLLRSLKVGQKVFADFTAKKVTLAENQRPCCSIIQSSTVPTTGSNSLPAPGPGTKSVTTNHSLLNSDAATVAVNPLLILPDLVPYAGSYMSSCSWNESQGETCESQCPPVTINIPLGTRNASSRPLTGQVRVRLLDYPSGNVVKEWPPFSDVAGSGIKTPGWITKTIVRCHPPGQASVSTVPPPNRSLVVETGAPEADNNNNARLIYLDPSTPIGP